MLTMVFTFKPAPGGYFQIRPLVASISNGRNACFYSKSPIGSLIQMGYFVTLIPKSA